MVEFRGNEAQLQEVVETARRRWPEFVAAFEERQPGQTFSIKAKFQEGEAVEWMWVEVTGMEQGIIYGKLGNDPVDLKKVRLGSRVRVKAGEIADWVFTHGNEMVGGFSVALLIDQQQDRRDE